MRKKNIAAVLSLTAALTTVGVAHAGWLVSGTSTSTVQTADPRLDVQASHVQGAYPGGTVPAQLTVTNPNSFTVEFGNISFQSVTVDEGHSGCLASVLSVVWTNPHRMMLSGEIVTFEAGVAMSPDAPQDCMGATFNVTWLAQGAVGTITP